MTISRRTIIIGSVAFVVVVMLVVGVSIAVVINMKHQPSPPPRPSIFKRCDGSSEPMGEIKIQACPDINSVGHCLINSRKPLELEFTFTAAIDFKTAYLTAQGAGNKWYQNFDTCKYGLDCPSKKGTNHTMEIVIPGGKFKDKGSGTLKFQIFDWDSSGIIFCVEFPAKIV